MAGHQFPQISSHEGSSVHAGDRYQNISSSGPILVFGSENVDAGRLLTQLQQSVANSNQSPAADDVSQKLAEVIELLRDLGKERSAPAVIDVQPSHHDEDKNPNRVHTKSITDSSFNNARPTSTSSTLSNPSNTTNLFNATFTIYTEPLPTGLALPFTQPTTRFTVDLSSSQMKLVYTVHILCNGGTGNFDAAFPVRWTTRKTNYGLVVRFAIYLVRGWKFVEEDRFGATFEANEQRHYCVEKVNNKTDDNLNLIAGTTSLLVSRPIVRCEGFCCTKKIYHE